MELQWFATTFDPKVSVSFKEAITVARPGNDGALWYRLPETIKDSIVWKKEELIQKIKEALSSSDTDSRRGIIKWVFVELLLTLETWFTADQVKTIIDNFDKFSSDLIVPIEELKGIPNTYLLNETTGPTNAFKDIALQMVTSMVSIIVEEQNKESIRRALEWERWQKLRFIITQTSTSWDTGPAGWAWIQWKNFVMNVIGFPANEATFAQIWQMMGLSGNVLSIPMNRAFSAIQEAMKEWNTEEYQRKLKEIIEKECADLIEEYGFEIEVDSWSLNSINPARGDWQMIYHEVGLLQAEAMGIIKPWEEIIEVLPSWNGGHMFSVLMARLASWYKWKTLVTCNGNNLFVDIIELWNFIKPPEWSVIHDPSVSMIIDYPNNMIRLFSYAFWPERSKEITDIFFRWERVILTKDELDILQNKLDLVAVSVTWEEELETIRNVFEETWRLICPHTANAVKWLEKYRWESHDNQTKALVSETASPWKFLAATATALNSENEGKKMELYERYKKLENSRDWSLELLEIIKRKYASFWYTFNESLLPENLREIYTNWFNEWDACAPEEFGDKTLNFLEKEVAPMFKKQVMALLEQ